MSEQNVQIIQRIYAAFGSGDVPAILERVTEDTEWGFAVGASDVPWHQPVKGKATVPRFFGAIQEHVQMERFEPKELVHSGDHVIAHIEIAYTIRKTGKRVAMDQLHWWTLKEGRVSRLRHFEDTAAVLAAWRG
jgi:uncharacterized protein